MMYDNVGYLLCPRCGAHVLANITQKYKTALDYRDVENNVVDGFADGLYETTCSYSCSRCGKRWRSISAVVKECKKKESE